MCIDNSERETDAASVLLIAQVILNIQWTPCGVERIAKGRKGINRLAISEKTSRMIIASSLNRPDTETNVHHNRDQ